ncbi:MAG TPA: ABC transporter ATP-binding protein [Candidatus Acidoferrum sp.]|jgi:ABC-2 type transport system ATP-binding protein|nr:ABC transporter ATP-binding protein [Candidatus Acidoferrum sp.]
MTSADRQIVFDNVSKFYGEVLGVNRVSFALGQGITSLVGPNGSGKTTLMNLLTGLIKPTRGSIDVFGLTTRQPMELFRQVGYCTQFDSFPPGSTGYDFIFWPLRLHGFGREQAARLTAEALERAGMTQVARRKVAGYSKGMRQRIRLAQAIAHHPSVLVLDEPLNGLDPIARAEAIALFESLAKQGMHVIISSHILEEVDRISDRVVLMSSGYVVAEGQIREVRKEVRDHPMQILVSCSNAARLASAAFELNHVVEAKILNDSRGVLIRTRDPEQFYLLLNKIVCSGLIEVDAVAPADDDVNSIYQYLIGSNGGLT